MFSERDEPLRCGRSAWRHRVGATKETGRDAQV